MADTIPVYYEAYDGERFLVGEASQPDEQGNVTITLDEDGPAAAFTDRIHDGIAKWLSIGRPEDDEIVIEEENH